MAAHSALSVLIVDDDFMVASVHRAFTERVDGFAVQGVAHTGSAALAHLERQQPDLILLDVYLPDKSGLQVLWEIRARHIQSDVILITAARDVPTVRTAMRGGVVRYIIKPFGFAKFQATLQEYAHLRQRLGTVHLVDQAEVDQVYGTAVPDSAVAALPKGLSGMTLTQVVEFLAAAPGPVTAEEVAAGVGVTRVTARRYLEHLAACGQAQRAARYGAIGRPEHRYWVQGG